jgi:hypothetical protein
LALTVIALGPAISPAAGQSFEFAFLGDNPYGGSFNVPKFQALIEDVNGWGDIGWVIHAGDTKAGADPCSDRFLRSRFDLYQGFDPPFVFTPGDNDWYDCGRAAAGGFDDYERLAFLRGLYYPVAGQTTGGRSMAVRSQSSDAAFGDFVENVTWEREGVVFSTIHLIGAARPPTDPAVAERRMDAAIAWIRAAFARARELESPGVFLATQVDLWRVSGLPVVLRGLCPRCSEPTPGMDRLYPILVEESLDFGKPVVLAVGDTHIFRVDKPLYDPATGRLVDNFTRVETFGNPLVHWVRVVVDPETPQVFSFHQQLVAANLDRP